MPGQRSMAGPRPGAFVLPLAPDSPAIGGKARSLARLDSLGLRVPPGFAVGAALFRALRAGGPALPARLRSAADLAALDAARDALIAAKWPAGFEDELTTALGAREPDGRPGTGPLGAAAWAIRSSAATEDSAGALAPGVYASLLRVPRDGVADAIRRVLASFLTPAAWMYLARKIGVGVGVGVGNSDAVVADVAETTDAAVLVHVFVDGDSTGTVACEPSSTGAPTIGIDVRSGEPTDSARADIEAGARTAAGRYGAVEIEWVARGDEVVFLQLRPYRSARDVPALSWEEADGDLTWTWDAAHNPHPLSPAAAGLVELVDARCRIGIRQRVIRGYLYYRQADQWPAADGRDARASFEALRAAIEPRIAALGAEPPLADALDLFVAAYQPLFGVVGPACVAARKALADFLARACPHRTGDPVALGELLAGIPSAATRRRAAADAIAAASGVDDRRQAIETYLQHFGDESPRWDVAEPTWRETPERLLLLGAARFQSTTRIAAAIAPEAAPARDDGAAWLRGLTATERKRFDDLVASARDAVAVGEDDDALYARLQAAVRRALLGLGRRLAAAGRLDAADDVFYLPLSVSWSLAPSVSPDPGPAPGGIAPAPVNASAAALRPIVAAAREALALAVRSAPSPTAAGRALGQAVQGLAGAGGRIIGRAVYHPPAAPLGGDSVLIAATLLPTELPLLDPAAIVVETGEVLGHVAAQARERGIPAVVGARGARAAIPEGALVVVDGDRGEVVRLGDD